MDSLLAFALIKFLTPSIFFTDSSSFSSTTFGLGGTHGVNRNNPFGILFFPKLVPCLMHEYASILLLLL